MAEHIKHHLINGNWYMISHENLEKLLFEIGCSEILVSRLMPLLTITGENGHVEHYTVDLTRRVVRHCTYTSTNLLREFVVPLDVESPGWSLSGKFIKLKVSMFDASTLVRDEIGEDYTLKVISDVNDDNMVIRWTSLSGNAVGSTCTMRFKKSILATSAESQ